MRLLILLLFLLINLGTYAQYEYEPSKRNPYGLLNPDAPKQTADYAPLIGECTCKSLKRIDQTTWADTVDMQWTFKYIMNGMAVQDLTLKADQAHSGSIRQYNADSAKWYVHFYASATPTPRLSSWQGNKNEAGDMILYKDQPAPNGTEGSYRITFSEISKKGFNWVGEWVNKEETIAYPTWKIFCKRE